MASTQTESLTLKLARIRSTAIARLVTLTSLPAEDCSETYLFENDLFCGVRWTLGEAKAVWRTGSDEIKYQQSQPPIPLKQPDQSPPRRRAA